MRMEWGKWGGRVTWLTLPAENRMSLIPCREGRSKIVCIMFVIVTRGGESNWPSTSSSKYAECGATSRFFSSMKGDVTHFV
jgi:hypothetical protein